MKTHFRSFLQSYPNGPSLACSDDEAGTYDDGTSSLYPRASFSPRPVWWAEYVLQTVFSPVGAGDQELFRVWPWGLGVADYPHALRGDPGSEPTLSRLLIHLDTQKLMWCDDLLWPC